MPQLALALLKRGDGIYSFQRRDGGAPTSPNKLALFGGHIEADETKRPLAAMQREISEETSLTGLKFKHLFACMVPAERTSSGVETKVDLFEAAIPAGNFEVYEGQGAEDYTLEEILSREDVAKTVRFILEKLVNQGE